MDPEPLSTASELRRIARLRSTATERRRQILDMVRWGLSPREMYAEGQRDGQKIRVRSLTDVLVVVKECGLGIVSILEESREHLIVRVYGSLCCQLDFAEEPDGKRCHYLAGFLAGALESTGCSGRVQVRELHCGGGSGNACMFLASW